MSGRLCLAIGRASGLPSDVSGAGALPAASAVASGYMGWCGASSQFCPTSQVTRTTVTRIGADLIAARTRVTGVEIGPLCRMASGSFWGRSIPAGWTTRGIGDELHMLGNGLVPQAAAVAYLRLSERLDAAMSGISQTGTSR